MRSYIETDVTEERKRPGVSKLICVRGIFGPAGTTEVLVKRMIIPEVV